MATLPLYRRVMGANFEQLPEVLKRFHDHATGSRARGTFRVVRSGGLFRKIVAEVLRMPAAGDCVPIQLEVAVDGDRERWLRHFPDQCTTTVQWADGHLLMEQFGMVSFSCALVLEGSRLRYEFRRAWFAGIPLPALFSPHVESYVDAGDSGWRVAVHIFAPVLGEIVQYGGWIEPE